MQNARATIQDCYSILVSSPAGGTTTGSECWSDFIAMHSAAFCAFRAMHSSAFVCNALRCTLCNLCNALRCICVKCTQVHLCAIRARHSGALCTMHSGAFCSMQSSAFCDVMHSNIETTSFNALSTFCAMLL